MAKEVQGKQIAKNVSLSLFAQVVSLAVSFIMGLIVPKFIDEYQYAYWHTFLLYVGYVGVLHFGLLDGIVLRYSQYDYEELDKKRIRSQFVALLVINTVALLMVIAYGMSQGGLTQIIAALVAGGILTKNIFTYNSFLFQITNRIQHYAALVIAKRIVYGLLVVLLIAVGQGNFIWYCLADLAGDCAGIMLSLAANKDLHFGSLLPVKDMLQETWTNISSGILLMFYNWSSLLLVSGAKMMIEWKWGTLVFGKSSFAFSVSDLILTFVTAISVVLFPSLKRMKQEKLPAFYKKLRDMMTPFLFWSLLLYYPECWILEKWLPKYTSSLAYLGLLAPMVVYVSLVSILTNNYLKAYRQERVLLRINILAVMLSACLYAVSAYWIQNLTVMLLAVVFIIMLRSVVSEFCVMRLIGVEFKKDFLLEFVLTCTFLFSTQCFTKLQGFCLYLACLLIYSYLHLDSVKAIARQVKALTGRKSR